VILFCPSPLVVHSFCMRHQVTWHASLPAIDNTQRPVTWCHPVIRLATTDLHRQPYSHQITRFGSMLIDCSTCDLARVRRAKVDALEKGLESDDTRT
jgi:hypothetical protein